MIRGVRSWARSLPEEPGADLLAGGTDGVALRVTVGYPLLAAESYDGNSFDVAADDVGLPDVMREPVVVAVTLVEPEIFLLLDDDAGLDFDFGGKVGWPHSLEYA